MTPPVTRIIAIDWTTVITALVAILPAIVVGFLNYLQQKVVQKDVATVKEQTNHIKDALVAATALASHAAGVQDEKIRVAIKTGEPLDTVISGSPINKQQNIK